jgi:hypothetical protein
VHRLFLIINKPVSNNNGVQDREQTAIMCYALYYYCTLCRATPELADQGLVRCKLGDYQLTRDSRADRTCRGGKAQRLVTRSYHETCWAYAGGTRERFEQVNDQLRYEVNEWLYTDDDSIPTGKPGDVRIFRNFGNREHYHPKGTLLMPRNYQLIRKREAELEWGDERHIREAMWSLRDYHA